MLRHEIIGFEYSLNLLFTGLWFLTVLFILTVIGKVIYDALEKWKFYSAWFFVWCVFYLLPDVWVFNSVEYLLPFFVGGIICRNVNWNQTKIFGLPIVLLAFVACFHYFNFGKTMYNMGDNVLTLQYLEDTFFRFACGWLGILLSLCAIKIFLRWLENISWLVRVGTMTLPIYVLHQKIIIINRFLSIQTENILLEVVIAVAIMALTIAIYKGLHRNRVLALLLFGEVYDKR